MHVNAFEYRDGPDSSPRFCEHEWVSRYFNSLDLDTSLEEMVDFLVSLKAYLQAKGYEIPSLAEMSLRLRDELIEKGVKVDDATIELIYEEILARENALITSSPFSFAFNQDSKFVLNDSKGELKEKEFEISEAFAIGFIKALGGALLCIVPHPISIAIGTGLVLNGVSDMIQTVDADTKKIKLDEEDPNLNSSVD